MSLLISCDQEEVAMTGNASKSLQKLTSVSKSLNDITDQLNAELSLIESSLKKMNLGVYGWVQIGITNELVPEMGGVVHNIEEIGYGRYQGKWALLFDSYCQEIGPDPDTVTLLRDAPRESRIKAVSRIPELLDKLAEEASKLADKAVESAAQAKEIASALSKGRD